MNNFRSLRSAIWPLVLMLALTTTISFSSCKDDPVVETCTDGIQNQDETGVDCGGTICGACPSCSDGLQNQGESGIDCGGPCTLSCYTNPACSIPANQINENDTTIVASITSVTWFERASGLFVLEGSSNFAQLTMMAGKVPKADGNYVIVPSGEPLEDNFFSISLQLFDGNSNPTYTAQSGIIHVDEGLLDVSMAFCDISFLTGATGVPAERILSGTINYSK